MVNYLDKRAQIGETMTWIVATLVIVVILGVSVFVAVPLGSFRNFKFEKKADLLATKSFANYLSTEGVYNQIKKTQKISDDELSKRIEGFYQEEYGYADLSIEIKKDFAVSDVAPEIECSIDIRAELNNEKDILLCLGSK